MLNQLNDNELQKYGDNSNTGIVIMSGNIDDRFHILNINQDVPRMLGFTKSDLVDQNIKNHILPKFF